MGLGWRSSVPGPCFNLVQRWLGHAQLSTTAIYADAVGEVDVKLAAVHV